MITYKFRAYPTTQQASICNETLETCRRLYNSMLADRIENRTGFYDQVNGLVERKTGNRYLRAVHSQVLQDVALRLDKAFQAFFVGLSRYPKFRRYGRYRSFTYPQSGFELRGDSIRLSKVGWMKLKVHRAITGSVLRVTVIKDIDQWFVSILTDGEPDSVRAKEGGVGVDLGIINMVALSDGTTIRNPKFFRASIGRVRSLQRSLSRKKKGSHNREKARILVAKALRTVRRQREDFAHKLSDALTRNNKLIVFEDLKVENMVKNHSLAKAIMDAAWGKFRDLTVYKAERRGGRTLFVNPGGSSQKCSGCGAMVPKDLSVRTHECPNCGLKLDRDVNAARNILSAGQELARAEVEPILVQRRRISKFAPVKQEVRALTHGSSPTMLTSLPAMGSFGSEESTRPTVSAFASRPSGLGARGTKRK